MEVIYCIFLIVLVAYIMTGCLIIISPCFSMCSKFKWDGKHKFHLLKTLYLWAFYLNKKTRKKFICKYY